ncbi:MAG: asparagine synthase (glutamine-hydrolyzing) [Zunongwangia sp.]|jgi:asparagine synthase (glutamine-hydrolysing)|uniref:asparagine synthase (glutamine-hydrolyzing) n=2 Tax=Zunongwangia profunda TaxID=398743 RepID=UPI000C943A4C|nr:asparagine synthase (glutamine-hydrolyzing) [Zunongwangia profunda]MAG89031.1 asparagine synthase (glutamine-hydrolyzing) [Flavobacteriaceae bacterium]MAO35678.1 asparagine synthase (glutamine-hydrolyzing) [Zunongwangia sp.]MCC4230175.1 asparagine synthase (glutamine-hydrolyzing) [Zunongwangia profunda]|tara:strand:- start:19563 stop:21290 length:1728 start_codon:yes stop_codon:yes gene_type:complete
MCGIAGIISENPNSAIVLQEMLAAQKHRGPDHTGFFEDQGFACIGHNRLSIIDTSSNANQPFKDPSGRFILTFNGEIYNYKELKNRVQNYNFKTTSDTEVLLALYLQYGKDCLQLLNGMFSFAIWDTKNKKLFAARDRFGVKPFYYSEENKFRFSSEIKALNLHQKTEPNKKVWSSYFLYGSYGMPDETFYSGIKQLPAGHYLDYDFSSEILTTTKWYNFEERIKSKNSTKNLINLKEEYLELLKDSIKLRFRADVPLAFNLSGGVDSSLLLDLVDSFRPDADINAFTFYTGDKKYDELPWVEEMIRQTNKPLQKVKLSVKEIQDLSLKISKHQDEPFGGIPTLAYSKIFKNASEQGIKVLLDGQGMDEQWAGYDYYLNQQNQTIQGLKKGSSAFKKEVIEKKFQALATKPVYPTPFESKIQNTQYRDLFYTKLPRALRFNDRISMAYSTELREPFLDYRLVELAFSAKDEYKINGNSTKHTLRQIAAEFIPKNTSYAPKRPLQTPQREWIGNDLKDWVTTEIEHLKHSIFSEWFDHRSLKLEWESYLNGNNQNSFYIWQWVNTALLISKFDDFE